jgi:RNA polymerase sigma-70 factor (ECF subfamily)
MHALLRGGGRVHERRADGACFTLAVPPESGWQGGTVDDHAELAEPAETRGPAQAADRAGGEEHPPGLVADFDDFYRGFVPTLVAFLLWLGARLPDAADITQETMIEAFKDWGRIEKPEAWARRVASRKYARRISIPPITDHPVGEVDDTVDGTPLLQPEADVAAFEERHEVLRILELLPPRQRQVMAWTFDGYKPAEIAKELKMRPEAVRSSLLKARRTLGGLLGEG